MSEKDSLDILNFMVSKPEIIWMLALMGAVCVIGVVDYLKCFFEKKRNVTRWVVLFMSLFVAVIISPLVPTVLTTIIIIWLLILALATIGKKHIIDSIEGLIDKMTGIPNINKGGKN
jgi:predicted MFS family arabinose efflux permease